MIIDISKNKQCIILSNIGKQIIDKAKVKFTNYNAAKYFKLYSNSKEDKDLFINGNESIFGIINCISPAKFNGEYGYNNWLKYNEVFNFIYKEIEKEIKSKKN